MKEFLGILIRWTLRWMFIGAGIGAITICCIPAVFAGPLHLHALSRGLLGAIVGGLMGASGAAIDWVARHKVDWRVIVLATGILLISLGVIAFLFWSVFTIA
jgi:hypothetical protein